MRFERWYWLIAFCLVSMTVHTVVGFTSPRLPRAHLAAGAGGEITVELDPEREPDAKKQPEPKPEPKPDVRKQPGPKPEPKLSARKPEARPRGRTDAKPKRTLALKPAPEPKIPDEPRPAEPKAELGGEDRRMKPVPLPLGSPPARRELPPPPRLARALPERLDPDPSRPATNAGTPTFKPRLRAGALDLESPLLGSGAAGPEEKPRIASDPGAEARPSLRDASASRNLAGGGALSPAPLPGREGLRTPEQPDDGLLYNGGGAGGTKLPKGRARIGGGGGRSALSVDNPLASERIAEDRPGLGPGVGGGSGTGSGGGSGFGRGQGVGTALRGPALAAGRTRPGSGIGAGRGSGIGTAPPGVGRDSGSDLPGTGGNGFGYGRGSGAGVGNGSGPGIGGGRGGPRLARGGGRGDGGSRADGGGRAALNRGIPFGDILGLLRGDPEGGGGRGGGPGGPGRGAVPGKGGSPGGSAPVHIVYVLDTSGSMTQGDKIGKAQEALKKAISELKPGDTFNVVCFDGGARQLSDQLMEATPPNRERALRYIEAIQLRAGTNISAGMERALVQPATHIFLLSDGEPSRGITDEASLRHFIRTHNLNRALIATMALGLGESFPGIPLLKGIAMENGGQFSYVNLAR